jgi:hypothetical protein
LHQIALLSLGEIQGHAGIVMIDDSSQRGEASVVVEAAFSVCEQVADRRCAVAQVGGANQLQLGNS